MSILNDELSIWEIGFRWGGYDPRKLRLGLPLPVRDNFRILLDAIRCTHLHCLTLNHEKYQGNDPEEARFYIRYWLTEVEFSIDDLHYNKKLLKWGRIERGGFLEWCERRGIPLPEFWFPNGWKLDFEWPDSEGDASSEHEFDAENAKLINERKINGLRPNQRAKIACQQIALNLWKLDPELTIAAIAKNEIILTYGGAQPYDFETVRDWISEVASEEVSSKRGRPKKKNPTERK
jgi:hypothetical protein